MNNYWEKRKALLMFEQMEQAEHHAEDIARMHDKAMHYLQRQADKVFDKFKRDYGLTETQARQILKSIKSPNDVKELKKALQSKEKNPNIDRLLADLDSSAYAFRINRFEQLQKETDRVLKSLAKTNVRTSKDYYKNFIADSYYKSTYNLQQQSGVGYPFELLSESEINALMHSNWAGGNYSSRIWKDAESLSKTLKDEFLLSLLTGKSVREVSEAISEKFNSGKFKSRRLVRTESAYFHGQMELKSYEEADVEYYRFVATLDLRTSNLCQEQDNKRYKVSDARVGNNYPPLHPWCRSTTIAADDDWVESRVRSAKVPATGKTVKVPENMSYQEWYDKYVMSNKTLEKRGTKAYNQSMFSMDLMAKQRSFTVGNDIRVKTKKLKGVDFDFWAQDNTKKIRDTVFNVQSSLKELNDYPTPTIVFLKKSRLPGFAGYDYKQDILFVSDALHSEKEFAKVLSDNYFAAQSIKDTIVHELTHKKHWDSAKAFYNANKKRYNSVEQAMSELNSSLISYVKEQQATDRRYLRGISLNAYNAYQYHNNINELVAEVGVLGERIEDKILLQKVKEVLSWK